MPAMLWLYTSHASYALAYPMSAMLWLLFIPDMLAMLPFEMLPFKGVVSIHHSKQAKALRLSGALGLALRGIALKVLKRPLRA
jgi:hypothetical protein